MGELTSVGNISRDAWDKRFDEMKDCKDTYLVTVIEDTQLGKVTSMVEDLGWSSRLENLPQLKLQPDGEINPLSVIIISYY